MPFENRTVEHRYLGSYGDKIMTYRIMGAGAQSIHEYYEEIMFWLLLNNETSENIHFNSVADYFESFRVLVDGLIVANMTKKDIEDYFNPSCNAILEKGKMTGIPLLVEKWFPFLPKVPVFFITSTVDVVIEFSDKFMTSGAKVLDAHIKERGPVLDTENFTRLSHFEAEEGEWVIQVDQGRLSVLVKVEPQFTTFPVSGVIQ